jgi:hypothetical protein
MELLAADTLIAAVSNHMGTSASRATSSRQIRLKRPGGLLQMSNRELLHHLLAAEKQTLILFLPLPPRPARKREQELLIRTRRRQAALFIGHPRRLQLRPVELKNHADEP